MPDAESIPLLVEDAAEEHPEQAIEAPVESEHAGEAMPVEAASESEPGETHHVNVPSGPLDVSALVPDIKTVTPAPVFERREVADEIDQQLLPIFWRKPIPWLPDTSAQLRAWKAKAGRRGQHAMRLRRNLHTIKGSARMVGAMRLGELTHVMESRVIAAIEGQLAASGDVFDTLEAQLDRLAEAVERLKQGRPCAGP